MKKSLKIIPFYLGLSLSLSFSFPLIINAEKEKKIEVINQVKYYDNLNFENENYNPCLNFKIPKKEDCARGFLLRLIDDLVIKKIAQNLNLTEEANQERVSFFEVALKKETPSLYYKTSGEKEITKEYIKKMENRINVSFNKIISKLRENLTTEDIKEVVSNVGRYFNAEYYSARENIFNIQKILNSTKKNKKEIIKRGKEFYKNKLKNFINFINPDLEKIIEEKIKNKDGLFFNLGYKILSEELKEGKNSLKKFRNLMKDLLNFFSDGCPLSKFENKIDKYYEKLKYEDNYNNYFDDFGDFLAEGFYNNEDKEKILDEIKNSLSFVSFCGINKNKLSISLKSNIKEVHKNYIKKIKLLLKNIKFTPEEKKQIKNNFDKSLKEIKKFNKKNLNKDQKKQLVDFGIDVFEKLLLLTKLNENEKKEKNLIMKKAKEWLTLKKDYIESLNKAIK